jgi:RNA polymerase primary sigma factor
VPKRSAERHDDDSTLAAYLREIAKLPLLTTAEERELSHRIRQHQDDSALARLVESNLRFVVGYAKRYRGHGVSFLDLIHEGNLGLIEAARRFDPSRSVKFVAYAAWWVRQSMLNALSGRKGGLSLPVFSAFLPGVAGDVPWTPIAAPDAAQWDLGETRAETAMVRETDFEELTSALRDLSRKELQVLRLRFGLDTDQPLTLQQIGDRLRLSRERVRQIESGAKEKLRRSATLRSHLN